MEASPQPRLCRWCIDLQIASDPIAQPCDNATTQTRQSALRQRDRDWETNMLITKGSLYSCNLDTELGKLCHRPTRNGREQVWR